MKARMRRLWAQTRGTTAAVAAYRAAVDQLHAVPVTPGYESPEYLAANDAVWDASDALTPLERLLHGNYVPEGVI